MPAAAVIPAPIAYIKVVAVKRLVVELLAMQVRPGTSVSLRRIRGSSFWGVRLPFTGLGVSTQILYCEKNKVFKAGRWLVCVSME